MNLENLKTIILVILIGISLFLTFGMWNYQPTVDSLNQFTEEERNLNGTEESISTLVEPNHVILHTGTEHYGFIHPQERKEFFQEIQKLESSEFETEKITDEAQITNQSDIEVVFPTALPMEIVDSLFALNIENKESLTWSFQRVYYSLDEEKKEVHIEFISIDGRDKAIAIIDDASHYDHLQSLINEDVLQEFVLFNEGGTPIYLPRDSITVSRQTRAINHISSNVFVDIMFTDPSIVRQSHSSVRGTTYFTDSSQMRVTPDRAQMEYVSPAAADSDEILFAEDLLNKSIAHINSYKGWTDEYKLMDINIDTNQISYQMYYSGYPVYGWMSTIEQTWGRRLIEYQRPIFRVDTFLNDSPVELPSGEEIVEYLINESSYNLEGIKDIQVGYQLSYRSDDRGYSIIFHPSWYIYYGTNWVPLNQLDEEFYMEGGN